MLAAAGPAGCKNQKVKPSSFSEVTVAPGSTRPAKDSPVPRPQKWLGDKRNPRRYAKKSIEIPNKQS